MGRFRAGESGNPKGRPKGSKDKLPRGSVRAAFEELIAAHGGHDSMVNAILGGLMKGGSAALGFMELGAKVLDRTNRHGKAFPQAVQINFNSPLKRAKFRAVMPALNGKPQDGDDAGPPLSPDDSETSE